MDLIDCFTQKKRLDAKHARGIPQGKQEEYLNLIYDLAFSGPIPYSEQEFNKIFNEWAKAWTNYNKDTYNSFFSPSLLYYVKKLLDNRINTH